MRPVLMHLMASTFLTGPSTDMPMVVNTAGYTASTGSITNAYWPVPHQADDILLVLVQSANQAVSTPSGFTAIEGSPAGTGTAAAAASTRLTAFWARATGSGMAQFTIADSGDHTAAIGFLIRGAKAGANPIGAIAHALNASAVTTGNFPSLTTPEANCLALCALGHGDDGFMSSKTNGNLTNAAFGVSTSTTLGVDGAIGSLYGEMPATGDIGAPSLTMSTSSKQDLMSLAILPSTRAGAPTIALTNQSGSSSDINGSTCSATIAKTGQYYVDGAGQQHIWNSIPRSVADYEVYATATGTGMGGTFNTWIGCETEPSWYCSIGGVGTASGTVTLEIRKKGTTTVLATATMTLTAEGTEEPPGGLL